MYARGPVDYKYEGGAYRTGVLIARVSTWTAALRRVDTPGHDKLQKALTVET
jgi:hypothetical protein